MEEGSMQVIGNRSPDCFKGMRHAVRLAPPRYPGGPRRCRYPWHHMIQGDICLIPFVLFPDHSPISLRRYIYNLLFKKFLHHNFELQKSPVWTPLKTTGNSRGDGRLRDWGMRGIGNGGTTGI